jgi:two-component system, cell cycle sensor histidine kinase and response regulator CckA
MTAREQELEAEIVRLRAERDVARDALSVLGADKLDALSRAMESATSPFVIYDPLLRYTYVNPRAATLFDRTPEIMIGRRDDQLFPTEIFEAYLPLLQRALETGYPHSNVVSYPNERGQAKTVVKLFVPLMNRANVSGVLGFTHDLTGIKLAEEERLRLEEQIQHAQKLESLGVLAGGIAHDFKNALSVILAVTSLALVDVEDESRVHAHLGQIDLAARRATELAQQMLTYSGRGQVVKRRIGLNSVVQEMLQLLGAVVPKLAAVSYSFHDDLPMIWGDVSQIRQVVMNLLTNAAESLNGAAGTITVRTGLVDAGDDYLAERSDEELAPGVYAFLAVSDTGCGMSDDVRARVFEPFFSTKLEGRGLGLGVVQGIVRSHRGAIEITTAPDQGTEFHVFFPCAETGPAVDDDSTKSWTSYQGDGTVLVGDLDAGDRQVTRAILERFGFSVVMAQRSDELLDLFVKDKETIVAILVSAQLPSLGSEELAHELKALGATVPILFAGHEKSPSTETARFVKKPYKARSLVRKLRRALRAD